MKQNIAISVEKSLLRRERALAAQRGASISTMLAQELLRIADRENEYELARRRALAALCAIPSRWPAATPEGGAARS